MIKKINYIKNFGVFNSYRRLETVQDFSKLNIVYGWNYSGKTTISRIFQCFENKQLKEHYVNTEFEFEDYEGNKGNQNNLNIDDLEIRVFNSDFVRDNIHLEGERFNPILLLGGDTKKSEDKIKGIDLKVEKIKRIVKVINDVNSSLDNTIQTGLTQRAALIKENLQIVQTFSKTQLKPIFESVKNKPTTYLKLDSEVQEILKNATASEKDKLSEKTDYQVHLNFANCLFETQNLLVEVPEFSNTIQYFVENPNVANWIEKGLPLHENKTKCEFCGGELKEERISNLTAHFSEDLKNHKSKLDKLITTINNSKIEYPIYQKSDFYKELWQEFETNNLNLKQAIKIYNKQLENLIKLINSKKEKPFEKILDLTSVENTSESLSQMTLNYNSTIQKNTLKTTKFDKNKTDAIINLKNHYTAKFVIDIKLEKKEEKIELYKQRELKLSQIQRQLENEIKIINAEISKALKGKEKLNEYINKFLGRNEIQVEIEKEGDKERFRLKRNVSKAVNLSEGEKTAIAFSFFLTKLLECKDLSKVVVYIDDPISSLDSNHIFQVNAVIKDFFFSKENPEDVNPKILNCMQLFVSTHNFDFFSLLRELPTPKDTKKLYYFIKRNSNNESVLDKLPKSIQNYTSEYHYLFELIFKFNQQEEKDIESLMILPNAVRRFVELYTYSRIPGNENLSVDYRAEKLWGTHESKRILKVCHHFSHGNNIVRMHQHNDLICDIENAVSDLINLVSEDKLHYNELTKAIK